MPSVSVCSRGCLRTNPEPLGGSERGASTTCAAVSPQATEKTCVIPFLNRKREVPINEPV